MPRSAADVSHHAKLARSAKDASHSATLRGITFCQKDNMLYTIQLRNRKVILHGKWIYFIMVREVH